MDGKVVETWILIGGQYIWDGGSNCVKEERVANGFVQFHGDR